ncbi:hypothetical protein PFLUV_G00138150 [Perca fluviatilis]|uniref:Uncharacterized protein n=1 Tax=Perca fluviatilis TaxID=8168 RepID=A0A6A5F5V1_PERFL|nr:hypothetical protein PFLUV_G00138150 [Perca fluviatilis]
MHWSEWREGQFISRERCWDIGARQLGGIGALEGLIDPWRAWWLSSSDWMSVVSQSLFTYRSRLLTASS